MTLYRALAAAPLALAFLAPNATFAQDKDAVESGFSHTFELSYVTDYVFRGVSNSNEQEAVQSAYTLTFLAPYGVEYSVGAWASTLDPDNNVVQHEVDYWAGAAWSTSFADLGLYYTQYTYPGTPADTDLAYAEFLLTAGRALGPVYLGGEYSYSPDYYAHTGEAHYGAVSLGTNEGVLPGALMLEGHVGKQWLDDNAAFGTPDYVDIGMSLSHTWGGWFTAAVEYADTDLDAAECFGGTALCGDRVFLTFTASATPDL